MSDRLSLGIRWAPEVREGEATAQALMDLHETNVSYFRDKQARYEWWVEVFGASEQELEEMMEALARKLRSTRIWRKRERNDIRARYARLRGLTTAGIGLTVMWG